MITGFSTGQPQDTEPTIEVTWPESHVALVVLAGEHDLGSVSGIESAVTEALRSCSHLVIDLSAVQFVDSSIINLLVQTKRQADESDCAFNLVLGTSRAVERTLEICGVLPELERVKTLDEALARDPS